VFLVLLAVFTATMVSQPDVFDGELEFQTTSALAREQTLALGGTPEADELVARRFNMRAGGLGREDEWFSWFGVGQAFVGLPFYFAGTVLADLLPEYELRHGEVEHAGVHRSEYFQHLLVGWRNPVLAAWTALLIVLTTRRLGAGRRNAWIAGLTFGLCTFAWPQARSTLNMVQTTFFLFLAFHELLVIEERLIRQRRPGLSRLALFGAALGAAFLTRSLVAPVLVVLGIAALFVLCKGHPQRRVRTRAFDLLVVALPALALLGLFLWTNRARFGDPLEQGYGGVVTLESYFNYPLHLGLAGILLAPGQGLLWMAPACVFALPWFVSLLRRGEFRTPLVVTGVAAGVLVPVCMTVGWHGAWGYGPRYALPLLPFLWLGVAPTLDRLGERKSLRPIAWALFGFGFLVTLPGVLVDTTTHTAMAVEVAQVQWPELPGNEKTQEEERFQRIRWDLGFAAPWAHWRILRHRAAGLGEEFPIDSIFFATDARPEVLSGETTPLEVVRPPHDRDRGFRHFAWIDFSQRLEGPLWPIALLCTFLLLGGAVLVVKGLDPDRP